MANLTWSVLNLGSQFKALVKDSPFGLSLELDRVQPGTYLDTSDTILPPGWTVFQPIGNLLWYEFRGSPGGKVVDLPAKLDFFTKLYVDAAEVGDLTMRVVVKLGPIPETTLDDNVAATTIRLVSVMNSFSVLSEHVVGGAAGGRLRPSRYLPNCDAIFLI